MTKNKIRRQRGFFAAMLIIKFGRHKHVSQCAKRLTHDTFLFSLLSGKAAKGKQEIREEIREKREKYKKKSHLRGFSFWS